MLSFLLLDFHVLHAVETIELSETLWRNGRSICFNGLYFEEFPTTGQGFRLTDLMHQAYMEQNTDTRHPKGYVPRLRIQIQALCHPIARNSSFYQWATRKL